MYPRAAALVCGSERRRGGLRLQFGGRLLARRAGEREALLLAAVCALDMYTTVFWVVSGHAVEANPLLAWLFDFHPLAFTITKSVSCLPALVLAPHLARRHPRFTVLLLRAVIAAYLAIYFLNVR